VIYRHDRTIGPETNHKNGVMRHLIVKSMKKSQVQVL